MGQGKTELRRQLQEQQAEVLRLRRENALLRQKIDLLSRKLFGKSSEKLSSAQLELVLEIAAVGEKTEEDEDPEPEPPKARARRPRKPRLPEDLPVEEKILDPEEVIAAPEDWRQIGQEVSEQLDYEPGRFIRKRLIRRKFVHRKEVDRGPVIAPLPPSLQERCLAAPGLLAQVIVSKYCDHLPLYRQQQIFKSRHGVELPRQTLARWIDLAADWLQPIYGHLRNEVFSGDYVQVDETPIRYLAPGNGKTKQGYLWAANRPGVGTIYRWATGRATAHLDELLPSGFNGAVQCDGYAAYGALAKQPGRDIALAGCWAHVRRKFFEAHETGCRTAGWFLRQIRHLYRIEARLREAHASPKMRAIVRARESRPIAERIAKGLWRLKQNGRHLPKSPTGRALGYTLNQWTNLQTFLGDGQIEIDNNLVENAIRPTAIGKKNWLFIGDAEAGQRSAILYTVVENCRRLNIDPDAYLRDTLTRLPHLTNRQIHTVTPEAWATRAAAEKQTLQLAS